MFVPAPVWNVVAILRGFCYTLRRNILIILPHMLYELDERGKTLSLSEYPEDTLKGSSDVLCDRYTNIPCTIQLTIEDRDCLNG